MTLFKKKQERKIEKVITSTGIDKVLEKCDCLMGSNVNGVREPTFIFFVLDKPPGQKLVTKPRSNFFESTYIRFVSCHILFRGR